MGTLGGASALVGLKTSVPKTKTNAAGVFQDMVISSLSYPETFRLSPYYFHRQEN